MYPNVHKGEGVQDAVTHVAPLADCTKFVTAATSSHKSAGVFGALIANVPVRFSPDEPTQTHPQVHAGSANAVSVTYNKLPGGMPVTVNRSGKVDPIRVTTPVPPPFDTDTTLPMHV